MGLVLSNPSTGGSGADNIVRVADIAARDALTPDSEVIVRVQDASADPNVDSGIAWYQWDGSSSYELIEKGESSKLTSAELASLISSLALEFVGGASYSPADPDELESDYPAATYSGKWALIWSGSAKDGIYKSNGTAWIKLLDDSGNVSDLWDYGDTMVYGTDNAMTATSGTSYGQTNAGVNVTPIGNPATAVLFNGSSTDYVGSPPAYYGNYNIFKKFTSANLVLSKFEIAIDYYYSSSPPAYAVNSFKIIGVDSSFNMSIITPISVTSTNSNASISGDTIYKVGGGGWLRGDVITVYTTNLVAFNGYGMRFITGGTAAGTASEFRGYEGSSLSDSIDCVRSINKLNTRLETLEADTTASDAAAAAAAATAAISSGTAGAAELYVKATATGDGSGSNASNYKSWSSFESTYGQDFSTQMGTTKSSKIILHIPSGETIACSNKYFCDYDITFDLSGSLTFTVGTMAFVNCRLRFNKTGASVTWYQANFFSCQIHCEGTLSSTGTFQLFGSKLRMTSGGVNASNYYMDQSEAVLDSMTLSGTLTMFNNSSLILANSLALNTILADEFSKIRTNTINLGTDIYLTSGAKLIYNTSTGVTPTAGDASTAVFDL